MHSSPLFWIDTNTVPTAKYDFMANFAKFGGRMIGQVCQHGNVGKNLKGWGDTWTFALALQPLKSVFVVIVVTFTFLMNFSKHYLFKAAVAVFAVSSICSKISVVENRSLRNTEQAR